MAVDKTPSQVATQCVAGDSVWFYYWRSVEGMCGSTGFSSKNNLGIYSECRYQR